MRIISVLLSILVVSAMACGAPPYPGRLVDVGGWRLHLNCTGHSLAGQPTVILEAGAGDFSFDWSLVQEPVARFARVCSYDRAGSAWSDLGPRPRTLPQLAYELHTLLANGGVGGPYILVGHSLGGLVVREFARTYPKSVAGIILVDATSQDAKLNIKGILRRVRDDADARSVPAVQTSLPAMQRGLSETERENAAFMLSFADTAKVQPPFDRLPARVQGWRMWAVQQPQHYIAEDDPLFANELQALHAALQSNPSPLGDIPLIVISRDLMQTPEPGATPELQQERLEQQQAMARLSHKGRFVEAVGSGHHVHIEAPKVVIDAIRTIIAGKKP